MSKNARHRHLTAWVDLQNSCKGKRRELTLHSSPLTSIRTPLPTHTTPTGQQSLKNHGGGPWPPHMCGHTHRHVHTRTQKECHRISLDEGKWEGGAALAFQGREGVGIITCYARNNPSNWWLNSGPCTSGVKGRTEAIKQSELGKGATHAKKAVFI